MSITHVLSRIAAALAVLVLVSVSVAAQSPTDRNKAVARRVFDEVLSRGRYDVSGGLYTKDFVVHGASRDFTHAEDLDAAKAWRAAFPDLVMRVDKIIAEDDYVTVRWVATGTNTGSGNGLPATGRRGTSNGITIFRFRDGRIAEEWSAFDMLGLYRQLGLLPDAGSK